MHKNKYRNLKKYMNKDIITLKKCKSEGKLEEKACILKEKHTKNY